MTQLPPSTYMLFLNEGGEHRGMQVLSEEQAQSKDAVMATMIHWAIEQGYQVDEIGTFTEDGNTGFSMFMTPLDAPAIIKPRHIIAAVFRATAQ